MDKKIEVLTKTKCEECDGAGVVSSQIWNEFFEIEKKSDEVWKWEKVEEWFKERGYSKLPPEEPVCSECEGSGEIQKWMDIRQLLELANIIG